MKIPLLTTLISLLFILLGCGPKIPLNTTFNSETTLWSWSGVWIGSGGASIHLTQEGNRVLGRGTNPLGQPLTLEGEVTGNRMLGSVTKKTAASGYIGNGAGTFLGESEDTMTLVFAMSDDGKYAKATARGAFGITSDSVWERTSVLRSLSGNTNTLAPSKVMVESPTMESVTPFSIVNASINKDEPRTALLIGNANYPQTPLKTPLEDVRAMKAALSGLAFDVILVEDAPRKTMISAIETFSKKLNAKGGVGLVFYAGHGMQIKGTNYLLPTDANIQSEISGSSEAVDLELLVEAMSESRTRVNVIILDACRNNPFERRFRGSGRGLAPMNAGDARGMLIAYSTAPGKTASDGEGQHSPYAQALTYVLKTHGLTIEQVFKNVRQQVEKATGGAQIPWESSSLTGELVLN